MVPTVEFSGTCVGDSRIDGSAMSSTAMVNTSGTGVGTTPLTSTVMLCDCAVS